MIFAFWFIIVCPYHSRVMLIFEDVIFPLWNHLFLCYPCHATFKPALVFKIGPILELILIAQKKRPGELNSTQKTPALCNVLFLNKSRKTFKKWHFRKNLAFFGSFFLIFSGTVPCRELGSFALYSVQQDASFELSKSTFRQFFKKGHQVLSVVCSKVVLFMCRKGFLKIFFYKYLSFWC